MNQMLKSLTLLGLVILLLSAPAALAGERGDYRFEAHPGSLDDALLTVSNPHTDQAVTVWVAAWSERVEQRRTYTLELEPGGETTLTFAAPVRFDRLTAEADGRFDAELRRGDDLVLETVGPQAMTRSGTTCEGFWTLTCLNCSYGPYTAYGKVESGNMVYWNLNTPTGPWHTVGGDGITTAIWYHDGNGCPFMVRNSNGQRYSVYIP